MHWTPDLDRRLLALGDITAAQLASTLTEQTGIAFTEDQCGNRRKRLTRAIHNAEIAQAMPDEPAPPLPSVGAGEFVGLRTLYTDIEATDLGASFGHLLCCSFCNEFGTVDTARIDDPRYKGEHAADDHYLAIAIRDRWEKADVLVGHNIRLYDKPFLNARLVYYRERPLRKDLMFIDTLYLAGGQNLRIGSRRLDNVAKFLHLPDQKTPLDGSTWMQAAAGVTEAIDRVCEHCEADVRVERDAFAYLSQFVSVVHR